MTVIGTAEVRVVPDAKGFGPNLVQQVEKPTKDVFTRIGGVVAGAFAARTAITFLTDLGNAAGDAAETASKASIVFGSAADSVAEFAESAPEAIGLSSQAAQEAAGTYGNLFRAIGLAEGQSASMSTTLIQLAGDLASFNNADPTEVLEALRAGLVGETEPLRRFGININEAALRQEALNQGLEVGSGVLSAAVKAQASYALIMQQTSLAQGDFARTGDGLANQQRTLAAEWANAKVELGQGLAPVMLEAVGIARDELLPAFLKLGEQAVPLLANAFQAATPLLGTGLEVLLATAPALTAIAGAVDAIPDPILQLAALSLAANQGISRVTGGVVGLMGNLRGLGTIVHETPIPFDKWTPAAARANTAVGGLVTTTQAAAGAAGLAFTAYSLLASELARIEASAAAFGATIRDKVGEGINEAADPVAYLGETINTIDQSIADLGATVDGSSAPWDADVRREMNEGIAQLEAQRSALHDMQLVVQDLGNLYGITAEEAGRFATANGIDLTGSAEEVTTAFREAYRASFALQGQIGETGDASLDTAEDLQAQITALEELTSAQLEAVDSQIAYRGATRDVVDANAELLLATEAVRLGGAATAEEQRALAEAMDAAETAAIDQAEAALRLAEDQFAAAGQTLNWQDKNRILQAELANVASTLAPDSPLRARLGQTIAALGSVPGTYTANVEANTTDAAGALIAIITLMDEVARRSGLNVLLHGGGSITARDHANAASGFAGTVTRPTTFLTGEGGEPEDVLVVPHSQGGIDAVLAGLQAQQPASARSLDAELLSALRDTRAESVQLIVPRGALRSSPAATAVELHRIMRRDRFRRQGAR